MRWGKRKKTPREESNGPVRKRPDLVGEVRNLKDPELQERSVAAIMARKVFKKGHKLSQLSYATQVRELTKKECDTVFNAVGWKHGQGKS